MPTDPFQQAVDLAAARQPHTHVVTRAEDQRAIAEAAGRGAPPDPVAAQRDREQTITRVAVAVGRAIGQRAGYDQGTKEGAQIGIRAAQIVADVLQRGSRT